MSLADAMWFLAICVYWVGQPYAASSRARSRERVMCRVLPAAPAEG
jgi:hypothetical protein